jgi:hypothetical protein
MREASESYLKQVSAAEGNELDEQNSWLDVTRDLAASREV